MRNCLIIIILILASCTDYHRYAITEEDAGLEYYQSSFKDLKVKIAAKPGDINLRKQKLFVSDKLGWPEDLHEDIELIIEQSELDYQAFGLASEFYEADSQYKNLLAIIDYWESVYGIDAKNLMWKSRAYLGLQNNSEVSDLLAQMLRQQNITQEELLFAASSYLTIQDTLNTLQSYRLLAREYISAQELTDNYVPLLVAIDSINDALSIFTRIANARSLNLEEKLLYGEVLFKAGNQNAAHQLLQSDMDDEALLYRSDWYARSEKFDSAIMFIDPVIASDSSNHLLLKKAQLSDKKGLYNQSLRLYRIVQQNDSTDIIAKEEAKIVERKIAYLRKLKAQENRIPMLDLNKKKSTDNE